LSFQDPGILILDGQAAHFTPRVMAFAASRNVMLIGLIPYSPTFGFVRLWSAQFIYQRERQIHHFNSEMTKMIMQFCPFLKQ
jgi:uncharacterized membrane protein (GlpM family)